ncbi:hypothetical protein RIF29_41464 [Crotalaria pallida]|uniref:NmrA-like domain-containing protein n=1 Tax=Crotalaria pallida TaxID=3830 RepID=A0AAN9EAL5_CROPI
MPKTTCIINLAQAQLCNALQLLPKDIWFFPSEFGNDVDRVHAVDPAKSAFKGKAKICRTIEAEGIPHTYVASNFFAGYFLPNLSQPSATFPPRDKPLLLCVLSATNVVSNYNEN